MIQIGYVISQTWPVFYEIPTGTYPDGMPLVKGWTNKNFTADTMILRAKTLEEFVTGMFLVDALWERGTEIRNLVLPHVPGGRQDRINPEGDLLFTLKSVARMINDRQFDSVTVFDPHSNVTPALIDRCKVVTAAEIVTEFFRGKTLICDGVIAPDAGAAKRAFDTAQALGVPFLQAEKHRDVADGKLSGFACNGLEAGKHYLVVDDICDGGGTFIGLGKVIKEAGATADLYVTHGVFSKGTKELNHVFANVFTTNTTDFDKHNANVFNAVETFIAR